MRLKKHGNKRRFRMGGNLKTYFIHILTATEFVVMWYVVMDVGLQIFSHPEYPIITRNT